MNRVYVVEWMLVLMFGTGCPVGGEAGVLRRAMLMDLANDCMAACIDKMNERGRK